METEKKGKISDYLKAVGLGICFIMLFYMIQFMVMAGIMFVKIFVNIAQAGGDIQMAAPFLAEEAQSPEFLTNASAVMTAVTTLVFGVWYKASYGKKFMRTGFKSFKERVLTRKNIVVFFLTGLSCYFVEIGISSIIALVAPGTMDSYLENMENIMGGSQVVTFIFVALLAPVGEECVFRGLLLRKYLQWMPVVPALAIQAVFFGIFHMNVVQGLYVLIIGLAAGYTAYRCNSVLPAIFIHFVNNAMPSVLRLMPEPVLDNNLLWTVISVTVILLLAAVIKYMPGEWMGLPGKAGTASKEESQ